MQAHAATGQRCEAARQYRKCESILRDDLQIRPAPETQALMASILTAGSSAPAGLPALKTKPHITAAPALRRESLGARFLPMPEDLRAECEKLGIKGERALAGVGGNMPTKRVFREMTALLLRVGKHSSSILEAA
jgi:hypothetical protein